MVWLGMSGEGLSTPVIFEDSTMNAKTYIKEVFPVARKCGNNMLGSH